VTPKAVRAPAPAQGQGQAPLPQEAERPVLALRPAAEQQAVGREESARSLSRWRAAKNTPRRP